MGDTDQYPVFFDCPRLDKEQKKRIENYFKIFRKSGGGDCGPVTNVNDKVYSIAFKDKDAQKRVLQRSKHVLEFAGGPLELIVRDSPGPATLGSKSSQQRPQSTPASTPPPSGEEYELCLDSYLLRYLEECPKAKKELKRKLSSVACSAQLYPEKGRVLARSLSQPGAVDEVRNWKAEVDKLFDGYMCHHEVDPYKVKALLQLCSSGQATDEVKVYSEFGVAVVVGECQQVVRLMDVKDLHGKQESRLSVKETTIRLGEAKLRLLWKEIEHKLGRDFPGVKVTQADEGHLVLEGFVEDILKARDWIVDKEKCVLERKISDMSPHFLAFLRKAYGGPVLPGDFLGAGDKVEVELRDTELRFVTLSANELDDIEKKLQENFKEVKIDIPNCSAVPSELREKLKSKTNELNQVQYRAQVVFRSDSIVYLLGHTGEVEELIEAVTQFILDESNIEDKVCLPFPAQVFLELLQVHTFDHSGVTLHPLTSSAGDMVVLEGPSSKVTEVRYRLDLLLDSVLEDRITDDLPREQSFSGQENILSGSGASLSEVNTTVATYSLCDGLQVLVCHGDITKQSADALVNAANEDLDHCGGVAAALSKAGGPQVQKESSDLVKQIGKIPTGDVVLTTGGNLNCKKLLHAVGPIGGKADGIERLLEKAVQSALDLAELMEFQSIAMPCISSGTFGVPVPVCSEAIVTAVKKFGCQGGRSLNKIILIDSREEVVRAMHRACDSLLQGISTDNSAPERASQQAFQSAQQTSHLRGFVNTANPDQASNRRIVVLGKTGAGKSSLANTIFGENLFMVDDTLNSGTKKCQAKTKLVNGRNITLIDTPGFFDTDKSEKELKAEIVKCITECSPGPHAFLIVLKVDKFTQQEQAVIDKVCQCFSEDALKYATILFTHGDQLPEGQTIEEFVHQNMQKNKALNDLVKKCGGRFHVIDNRYWNDNVKSEYRSNRFQVEELLKTIDKMVMKNNGRCYTNEMLQAVEEELRQEEEHIRRSSSGNMSEEEIRQQAKANVSTKLSVRLAGIGTGALLGALFGVGLMVGLVVTTLKHVLMPLRNFATSFATATEVATGGAAAAAGETAAAAGGAAAAGETAAVGTAGMAVGVAVGLSAAAGATVGGVTGYYASEGEETAGGAAKKTAAALWDGTLSVLDRANNALENFASRVNK